MTRKSKTRTEVEMSSTTLSMLIDFYLGSIQRRGCTPNSVTSCQRALKQFYRYLSGGEGHSELMKLSGVTTKRLETYVHHLQNRNTKWKGHPHKRWSMSSYRPLPCGKKSKSTWI